MTTRAYYRDPGLRELDAVIVSTAAGDGGWRVVLDQTLFYPEGGGQPSDRGTLNGRALLGLEEADGEVIHRLDGDPGPRGSVARLVLDWPRRLALMQQHTGQHLLSQALDRLFAAPTLSFAIGEGHASIEIGRAALDEAELAAVEAECARIVFENRPLRVFETTDLSAVPLRKPPKVSGPVRVVEIEGYDWSACGGLHLRSSGELGLVKIVRTDKVRGNLRLYFVAGAWALADYRLKNGVLAEVQRLVMQPPADIPAAIARLQAERDELRREVRAQRRREMEEAAAASLAGAEPLVARGFAAAEPADVKAFALALVNAGRHVLAWSSAPQPYLVAGRGAGTTDLRPLAAEIFAILGGRGGGRDNFIEGKPASLARIDEVAARLRAALSGA